MNDDGATIRDLKALVLRFSRERDWERFHRPKDLGVCLAIEAGEVLEHFRFRTDSEIEDALREPDRKRELSHEMADCLWALLRLADVCEVDLSAALVEKIGLAALKYPIELAYGRAEKYTAYAHDDNDNDDGETGRDGHGPV